MTFFPPGEILLLPSALAVARERRRLLERASDGVILGPRIHYFAQLEREMTAGLPVDGLLISPLAEAFLLGEIVERQRERTGWPPQKAGPGLIRRLGELLSHLKTAGLGPEDLRQTGRDVGGSDRLNWLAELYRSYEQDIEKMGLTDRAGVRRQLLNDLNKGRIPPCLQGIGLIRLKGFHRLTPFQLALVEALANTIPKVEFHLQVPDSILESERSFLDNGQTPVAFAETFSLLRHMESRGVNNGNLELILVSPLVQHVHPVLSWLGRKLFLDDPVGGGTLKPGSELHIAAAPGRYAEMEHVGRHIRRLLENGGRPDRIGVAVPDLASYGQLIEDVFRRYRLPLSFRRGAPLMLQAPARAVFALARLAGSHWDRDLVLDLLASPYLNLAVDLPWAKAAELSARAGVTDERAGGGWDDNLARMAVSSPKDRDNIDKLRDIISRLRNLLTPLSEGLTVAEFSRVLIDILVKLGFPENLRRSGGPVLQRDLAAWEMLGQCLDDLTDAARQLGQADRIASPDDIAASLKQAMEGRNVGEPVGRTGGVLVVSMFDLHGLEFDYLFQAGLNEGEFPRPQPQKAPLDDDVRDMINRGAGRRVLLTSAMEYHQQELLFYFAATSARKALFLSYSRVDESGRMKLPSSVIDEVQRVWAEGVLPVLELPAAAVLELADVLSREELLGRLALDWSGPADAIGAVSRASVLSALCQRETEQEAWTSILDRASMASLRLNQDAPNETGPLDADAMTSWLNHLDHYQGAPLLSPTFLQGYAECPFRFWAEKILRLQPSLEAADEVNALNMGQIIHDIVHCFMIACQGRGCLPLTGRPEERDLLHESIEQILSRAERDLPLGRRPIWRVRRESLLRQLNRWLEFEQKNGDEFVPRYFEMDFGPEKKHAPLEVTLLSGDRLFFQGRIDRIDESPAQLRVIDYKNSRNASPYSKLLKEEELGRTSFQAPLYQAAASRIFQKPSQATYLLLRGPKRLKDSPGTESDLFEADPERRRNMAAKNTANFYNRLDDTWQRLIHGFFPASPDNGNCEYCVFRTMCRPIEQSEDPA